MSNAIKFWAVDAETLAAICERHQLQFYAPAF